MFEIHGEIFPDFVVDCATFGCSANYSVGGILVFDASDESSRSCPPLWAENDLRWRFLCLPPPPPPAAGREEAP